MIMKKLLLVSSLLLGMAAHVQSQDSSGSKIPFDGIETNWQNGSDRRDSSVFQGGKYFIPSIMVDVNYTHSFNHPNDNTVVGSTALARDNEVQLHLIPRITLRGFLTESESRSSPLNI
jgi:hypothetical protein